MGADQLNRPAAGPRDGGWRIELAILAGIWVAASVVLYLLAAGVVTPRRYQDEFLYWATSGSFAHGHGFAWRGTHVQLPAFLYPVLIAPAFRLAGSVSSQYELIKAANAVLLSAVVFPAFCAARMFVSRRLALLAALFALVVPAMNYAGIIGTESAAYPACTAAFAGMLLALARPGARSALIALALILLAVVTRVQFVILVPVMAGALVLAAALRGRDGWRAYLAEQRPAIALFGGVMVLGLLYGIVRGRGSVGIYVGVFNSAPITFSNLVYWARAFAADVYLLCAIVPAIATFALFGARSNRRDPLVCALLALTLVATLAFVFQMTWFSAINTFHWRQQHVFYERYMFYLGPLFFTGLVASFGRVTARAAAISALVATVIVGAMPVDAINVPFSLDAFGQAYLGFLFDAHEGWLSHAGPILAVLTLLLGGFYTLGALPPDKNRDVVKYGRALAVVLPLFILLITQAKAWDYQHIYADTAKALEPQPLDWVNRATTRPVGMLLVSDSDPTTFYQSEFWNTRVVRAFVGAQPPLRSLRVYSPTCAFKWSETGRILPAPVKGTGCGVVPTAWLVQSDSFAMHLRDETKRVQPRGSRKSTLMVARAPARIFSMVDGRSVTTGYVDHQLGVFSFLSSLGRLRLTFAAPKSTVTLRMPNGNSIIVPAGRRKVLELALPPGEFVVPIEVVSPPGGSARVRVTQIQLREGRGPWRSIT